MPSRSRHQFLGRAVDGTHHHLHLKENERQYGLHIMGAPGRGKSKFMEHLIRNDIAAGNGLCLLDPHGALYDDIVRWCVRESLLTDFPILLFEPQQDDWTFGFNPLKIDSDKPDVVHDAIAGMVTAISQIWGGVDMTKTPTLANRLPAVLRVAFEKGLTLPEALDLCEVGERRDELLQDIQHRGTARAWERFRNEPDREFTTNILSTMNRLEPFSMNPHLELMTSQTDAVLDMAKVMDEGGIVLVNLAKIAENDKRLLGMLLVNDIYTKGVRRTANTSTPFHVYLDECYYFLNEDVERIITGLRKFGVHLTVAHHNIAQLDKAGDSVRTAVMQIPNKALFGGLVVEDARRLVEWAFLGQIDLEKPKSILDKPTVVGYQSVWTKNYSASRGSSSGHTESQSIASASIESVSSSETSGEDPDSPVQSVTAGFSETISAVTGAATSTSTSTSESESEGMSESFLPVYEERPTAVHSYDEQLVLMMAMMVHQQTQHAAIKLGTDDCRFVRTPTVSPARMSDEHIVKRKTETFERMELAQSTVTAEAALEERRRRRRGDDDEPLDPGDDWFSG